jgi:GntR family transcriptional regulator
MARGFFNPFPKYLQIRHILLRRLQNEFAVGDKFPTEHALANSFSVSRETVREALRELEVDGLLSRRAGSGTFVIRRPQQLTEARVTGLVEDYTALGLNTETRLLGQEMVVPSRSTAEALRLKSGRSAYRIVRLRYLDGLPLAIHESYTEPDLGRRIGGVDLRHTTVSDEAQRITGKTLEEDWHQIEADLADSDKAASLDVAIGAPLLVITRLYVAGNKPVVLFRSHFRADRYFYTSKLRQARKARNATAPKSRRKRLAKVA